MLDNEGLKSTSGSVEIILSLAELYVQNNLLDQAIELLSGILNERPDQVKVIEKLIEIYILKGEEDNAKILLQKGLSIDKEYPGFQKHLGLLEEEYNQEIREQIQEVVEEPEEFIKEAIKTEEESGKVAEPTPPEIEEETFTVEEKEEEKVVAGVDPIKKVLSDLYEIEDVLGIILSDETGLLIAENVRVAIDTEDTGALLSSIYSETTHTIERLNLGEFEYMIFEFPRGVVLILASSPIVLTVMCKKDVQEGLLLLKAKGVLIELKKMLGV